MRALLLILCLSFGGVEVNFFKRLQAAWRITKGSIAPFDRLGITVGSGNKLTKAYAQSVWVNRAIKLVSLPITEVPLRFSTDARGGKQLIEDPALAEFWESPALKPNKQPLSLADTVEATVGWLKLNGNAFWVLDDTWLPGAYANAPFPEAGRSFSRFIVARPDRMMPIKDRHTQELLGWEMVESAGRRRVMALEQVIHFELWNPYDDCLGLGEMDPAQNAAESDYLAGMYEVNLWANNGDRGPIVGLPQGSMLDDAQRKQLEAEIREKKELAQRGIFKTLFLSTDIKVEDPKVQSIDAAVIASRASNATQIAIAFGVPPSMFTVAASYSIGSASDRYRLIEDTSAPTAKKISEGIERVIALQFSNRKSQISDSPGRRVFAWFDFSKHSVFAQVRLERIDGGTKLFDRGWSWDDISAWTGSDMPQFPGSDKRYLPFSLTPADMAGELPDEGDPEAGGGGRAATAPPQRGGTTADDDEPVERMMKALRSDVQKARSGRELAMARAHNVKRLAASKVFLGPFRRALMAARAEVLQKLDASNLKSSNLKSEITKAGAFDFMFNAEAFKNQLLAGFRNPWKQTLHTAGAELFRELNKHDPFTMPDAKVMSFILDREKHIADMSEAVHARVKNSLQDGLDKGETMDELAARVRAEFNGIDKGRSQVIAMTETGAAYGEARHEGMKEAGVTHKKWLTSGLPNVRPAHAAANGQVVPLDEPFDVGGENLMHPGDENGSPENVINCHCIEIAVADPHEPEETPT